MNEKDRLLNSKEIHEAVFSAPQDVSKEICTECAERICKAQDIKTTKALLTPSEDVIEKIYQIAVKVSGDQPTADEISKRVSIEIIQPLLLAARQEGREEEYQEVFDALKMVGITLREDWKGLQVHDEVLCPDPENKEKFWQALKGVKDEAD